MLAVHIQFPFQNTVSWVADCEKFNKRMKAAVFFITDDLLFKADDAWLNDKFGLYG